MKFSVKRTVIGALLLMAALYAGDYLWLRLRMNHPKAGLAFGTVRFYWATPTKNGRVEVFFDTPETETCAHSIFPHLGYTPCWYSKGRTVRVIR